MDTIFSSLFTQYGFGAAMAGFVALLFLLVLRWVMKHLEKSQERAAEREAALMAIIVNHETNMREHTQTIERHFESAKAAHDYQREEHGRMIQALDRIISR